MLRSMGFSVFVSVAFELPSECVVIKINCHVNALKPSLLPESHRNIEALFRGFTEVMSRDSAEHACELKAQRFV